MKSFFAWVRYLLLWIISMFTFFVIDGYFFLLVFVLITILPCISYFMMRFFMKHIQLELQYIQDSIQIRYTSTYFLPFGILKLCIQHKNIFYGECEHQYIHFICEPNAMISTLFKVDKSGKYECTIQTCVLYDLLGLFHKTISISQQTTNIYFPQPSLDYMQKQSTHYDEQHALHGNQQIGTDYELREYQPQDSLRYVHHKMSYKLSKIMIKQYEPEGNEKYSVYLDFTGSDEQCEEVLSLFYGYALDCLAVHMTLDAIWKDVQGTNTMHIANGDDIKECLESILSSPRMEFTYDMQQEEQADAIISFEGLSMLNDRG